MKNNNKYNIELILFIILNLSCIVLLNDYLVYFFDINYYLGMILSSLVMVGISCLLRNKYRVEIKFSKEDLIFFFVLFVIMAITIVFPDRMYDTLNYHLYSQENPFNSILTGDLFPGKNINSFTYSLTDRIFYPFRLLFGYRMGLILNYLLLITIYYEIKKIASRFIKNDWLVIITSLICVFNLSIIDLVDVYYADLFSVIYLLEIVDIALFNKIEKNNLLLFSYIGLLSGLAFVAKISNAYFVILFGLVFLIRNRHELKKTNILSYLLFLLFFIIPSFVYMYYTYKETGNPFFPFYNTLFKSCYYPDSNWMDKRFGPTNIFEVLFWPIIMYFKMNRAIDIGIVEPLWLMGYISSLIYVIIFIIKYFKHQVIDYNKLLLVIITLMGYLVWSEFILGYIRYGLILLLLSGLVFCLLLLDVFKKKYYVFGIILLIPLGYHFYYSGINYVTKADYWSYNNIFAYGKSSYKYNFKHLFHDYNDSEITLGDNAVWGLELANSGYMRMLNKDINIVSLMDGEGTPKEQELLALKTSYKNIYTLFDAIEVKDFISNLNASGYSLDEYRGTYLPSFINYNNYMYIYSIVKDSNPNNSVIETNKMDYDIKSNHVKITGWVGLDKLSKNNYINNYKINIIANTKDGNKIIASYDLNDNLGNMYEINIDTKIKNINKITVTTENKVTGNQDELWLMLLNYKVEE
jgi:hypothetical protein